DQDRLYGPADGAVLRVEGGGVHEDPADQRGYNEDDHEASSRMRLRRRPTSFRRSFLSPNSSRTRSVSSSSEISGSAARASRESPVLVCWPPAAGRCRTGAAGAGAGAGGAGGVGAAGAAGASTAGDGGTAGDGVPPGWTTVSPAGG